MSECGDPFDASYLGDDPYDGYDRPDDWQSVYITNESGDLNEVLDLDAFVQFTAVGGQLKKDLEGTEERTAYYVVPNASTMTPSSNLSKFILNWIETSARQFIPGERLAAIIQPGDQHTFTAAVHLAAFGFTIGLRPRYVLHSLYATAFTKISALIEDSLLNATMLLELFGMLPSDHALVVRVMGCLARQTVDQLPTAESIFSAINGAAKTNPEVFHSFKAGVIKLLKARHEKERGDRRRLGHLRA